MTPGTGTRYRLDSRIATGGMGEVWRATDTVLDREVAVKVLKPEYADDPTLRSRFEAEARHAAALDHPNVASVFDFGELDPGDGSGVSRPFLVMELVPGQPLSALLRAGEPMPPERAADLVAQAADAVASAHAIGIVHRDVKPANLLVTPEGRVKITDFGIARAVDGAALTQTGQVVGTPAYISPEQAEGRPATGCSDIYSLGVVLYECLAGARPFTGDTPVTTALAHLRDEPPPLPGSVPAHLRAAVATALAKSPDQRFPDMAAFAAAVRGKADHSSAPAGLTADPEHPAEATRVLTAVAATEAPPAATAPPTIVTRRRRRPAWLPWAGAAAAVLVVVVGVAALAKGTGGDSGATVAAPPASTKPAAATPAAKATVRVVASDYIGLPADEARARLDDLGLRVTRTLVANPGGHEPGSVADVSPTGTMNEGDRVTLSVWGPAPKSDQHQDEHKKKPGKDSKNDKPGKDKGHDKKGHQ